VIRVKLARKADECSAKTEVFSFSSNNKTSWGLDYNRPLDPGSRVVAVVDVHSRLQGAICRRIRCRTSSGGLELRSNYRNGWSSGKKKMPPLTRPKMASKGSFI
jgi:hypothetical protein